MKKQLFFFFFLLISVDSFAQPCPLDVEITSLPNVEITPVCKGTPVVLTAIPSVGAVSPVYYWIVDGDTTLGTGSTFSVFANNQTVSLIMSTSTGCPTDLAFATFPVQTVIITPTVTSLITECNQTTADVQIESVSTGGSSSYSYDLVGVGSSSTGSYSNVPQGTYTLYITDDNGCKDTSEVTVVPFDCPDPSPTETITPNDDGINDMWLIYNIQYYPDNEVFIFDRWGQRVYHKDGYDNLDGWKAKYVGVDMPVSTYYYILKITVEDGDDLVFKGPISVFR
ncbi:MAG: hypothetical protein COB15_08955 [Flavobacteriales bacterium]|nr:MAG: hypothetical protein COB15_08955 [Flavobacteriales bacterium]